MDTCDIRQAGPADSGDVCTLAFALLSELYPGMYTRDQLLPATERILQEAGNVFPFIANIRSRPAGLMVLNQCTAIYALGDFGEISELFVAPEHRSSGLGARMIEKAVEFCQLKRWTMLEVGAPELPKWSRTVDFYSRNGFVEVGPRLYRSITDE